MEQTGMGKTTALVPGSIENVLAPLPKLFPGDGVYISPIGQSIAAHRCEQP